MLGEYVPCLKESKVTCNKIIIVQNILNPASAGGINFPPGSGMLKKGISEYLLNQIPWPGKQEQDKVNQFRVMVVDVIGSVVLSKVLNYQFSS